MASFRPKQSTPQFSVQPIKYKYPQNQPTNPTFFLIFVINGNGQKTIIDHQNG
jgi:hypothetical protein